jgi:uncharacterized membrane protein YfhO
MLQALGVRYLITRSESENDRALAGSPDFRRIRPEEDTFCHVYEYLHARPPYGWEDERSGLVELKAWTPERREFLARSEHGGRFVLVEQRYPGWRATVDGAPVEIEAAGGAFQAIRLRAGEHRVRFEYRPASVAIGGAVSGLAWLALMVVMRSDRRARRKV